MSAFQPSPPNDLAVPAGGSMTGRAILSMALRKLFEDLKGLHALGVGGDVEHDYRTLRKTLVSFLPGKPGAIASLLRSPAVAAPLRCLRDGVGDRAECGAELVHQAFYQLELQGALQDSVELRSHVATCMSPLAGRSGPRRTIYRGAGDVARGDVAAGDAEGADEDSETSAYVQVCGTEQGPIWLACVDNNPLRLQEAHPDKDGNAIDLGGKKASEWVGALQDALELIGTFLPTLRREAELFVRQFVPVGFHPSRHLSATYQEVIGTIYLSLHPDPMTMAEAVIHELSHTKLNALLELDPLLLNDRSEAYPSPVRPDPRPLMGVLLAAHAFVPVAYLYEKMKDSGHEFSEKARFSARHEEIVAGNRDGVSVLLAHGRPTDVGRGVLKELAERTGLPFK